MLETIPNGILQEGIAIGMDRGISIGVDKGIAIGVDKGKIETARNMKAKGFSVADISDITGLSAAEIAGLD